MKILVVCQYYYPEPFRITDICEELVRLGHSVTVVTGTPNYPMGRIYPGYENGQKTDEILNGVTVHRCKIAPRKSGAVNRLRNYYSYARESKKYIKTLDGDFDVVFVNQLSPVIMAEAGIEYKNRYGKKLVLYCLDLWPESLCVGGLRKNSLTYKLFERISKRIYRSADEILVTSRLFVGHLKEKFGIEEKKISYLPQYAESQFLALEERENDDKFNLVFAGNIGTAQSIGTVIKAARILKEKSVWFHMVGDGSELQNLKEQAFDLPNVVFHGRKPIEEMPEYYRMADAMLVTLVNDPAISLTLPGKVQTYMAAGKPIVGAIGGETALVLKESQGGYCGDAEDHETLAENIVKLMNSFDAADIGKRNREYYLQHFQKEKFMEKLCDALSFGEK